MTEPVKKKPTVDELLAEIARSNPWVQRIEKEFPDFASSFTPSALGMTKMQYLKRLADLGAPGQELAQRIPKKLLAPIKSVEENFANIQKVEPQLIAGRGPDKVRANIWIQIRKFLQDPLEPYSESNVKEIKSRLKKAQSWIQLYPKEMRQETAIHEPSHILEKLLKPKEVAGLDKAFSRMSESGIKDDLQQILHVELSTPKEVFSEAYTQYLTGGIALKDFDPFVKHLVKKYHRFIR